MWAIRKTRLRREPERASYGSSFAAKPSDGNGLTLDTVKGERTQATCHRPTVRPWEYGVSSPHRPLLAVRDGVAERPPGSHQPNCQVLEDAAASSDPGTG